MFLGASSRATFAGQIIYVDADANGLNDGTSWRDAYKYLQDALADANSSTKPIKIWVAQGIYRPDEDILHPGGTGNREATFQLINGVSIKGGYAGFGAPDPDIRDIELYKTILSGDLNGDDAAVNPNHLMTEPTRIENNYHVVTGGGTDKTTVLDGFIVTGGNANRSSWPHDRGGGMFNDESSPNVNNCYFIGNSAVYGGGMFNYETSPNVNNCTFSENSADWVGGGMFNYVHSSPKVNNCTFSENSSYDGGGMYNNYYSSPKLEGCTFNSNSAEYGGGMLNWDSNPTVEGCTFSGNSAVAGGGMCNDESSPTVTNCTFTENSADWGGGMGNGDSSPTVSNCILWADVPSEIYGGTPTVRYSDVQGGWPGEGNINVDPCFADLNNDDFHLKSQAGRWDSNEGRWTKDDITSPCIDAGDPASPIGYEPFPNGGIINMGVYGGTEEASKSYFGEPTCETIIAGDINGDCKIDFRDFALMLRHWLEEH
jgi:hypothetical protein